MSADCRLLILVSIAALFGCSTTSNKETPSTSPSTPSTKYYKDDGPGQAAPANLDTLPDAVPRIEPLSRSANRPYTVFGREFNEALVHQVARKAADVFADLHATAR